MCKLQKSLYDLKQSPSAWYKWFNTTMKKFGYQQGQIDHTLFTRHAKDGKEVILTVYVDDTRITGDDTEEIEDLKKHLRAEFEMKDIGILWYFLGMEVTRYFHFSKKIHS